MSRKLKRALHVLTAGEIMIMLKMSSWIFSPEFISALITFSHTIKAFNYPHYPLQEKRERGRGGSTGPLFGNLFP